MGIRSPDPGLIVLEGSCPSDEAEELLRRLLAAPTAAVDLRKCESLHAAVVQVLLAAHPKLHLPPIDGNAAGWLQILSLPSISN